MKENLLKTSKDFISFLHKKRFVLAICAIITLAFGLLNIFVFSNHSEALDSDAFITTWKVSGDSDGRTVKIPVYKANYNYMINYATYNYTIDWGDGSPIEAKSDNISPSHTYANDGEYDIKIEGDFPGMTFERAPSLIGNPSLSDAFDNSEDVRIVMARKIHFIKQWGKIKWQGMYGMFAYAENMVGTYTDSPNTSKVENMANMFFRAQKFNSPVNFDTSKVKDMSLMFRNTFSFNQPINFDTSNVTHMNEMFKYNAVFNSPVNFSDTSKVREMSMMFDGAASFNQPINFDTQNVENMHMMFAYATSFNQPVNFN
ncbi:MAG: BspA family leucine-rich repeat surface protein, partial [Candidatus Saccharibacteria bacterium]|nr:BspA family leucine-rich repeat surface protein [Candidatus Saccharibacteria bacterium]